MSTPNEIEVMIHYYATATPHPRANAPAVKEAIEQFIQAGLLENDQVGSYSPTSGGKMFIEALCAVPWPKQQWVIPNAGHIEWRSK